MQTKIGSTPASRSASRAKSRFPLGLCAYACASGVVEDIQTSTVLNVLLTGVGGDSHCFPFHFVVFPTASLLPFERFSVIAVVTGTKTIEPRVVNLLAYPSLP